MPWAPLVPCAERPCPNRVRRGRCPAHAAARAQAYNATRGSSTAQGYGAEHQALRAQLIAERGNRCEDCGGPPTSGNPLDLDHVDGNKFNRSHANLRLRHHDEHSRKTALQDGRWGKQALVGR